MYDIGVSLFERNACQIDPTIFHWIDCRKNVVVQERRNSFATYFHVERNNKSQDGIKLQTYAHARILRHALPSRVQKVESSFARVDTYGHT